MTMRTLAVGVIGALAAVSPLLAHHDWPVDKTTQVTLTGTVTAYTWSDPHVTIGLDVEANGTIEKWRVGASSKKYTAAGGWDRNTFKPGDVITVIGYRFKDGSNMAQVRKVVTATGKELYYSSRPKEGSLR